MAENRQPRVRAANAVIGLLAATGPRFLYSPSDDRAGKLGLDRFDQVWYIDGFSGLQLYPFPGHPWRGFTAGAALQEVVAGLALYIRNGDPVDLMLIENVCAAAYGDAWPAVRAELLTNSAINSTSNMT